MSSTACNHTLSHTAAGTSWQVVTSGDRRKVVCRECGRFYGYINAPPPVKPLTPRQEAELKRTAEKSAAMLLEMREAVAQ